MLYLVCTTISSVDHARYEVPHAKDLGTCTVSGDRVTIQRFVPLGSMLCSYTQLERT